MYNIRLFQETQCQLINFQAKYLIENYSSQLIHCIFESQLNKFH